MLNNLIILYCEDDIHLQNTTMAMLQILMDIQLSFIPRSNGKAGLNYFLDPNSLKPNLILSDHKMGSSDESGLNLYLHIRKTNSTIPFILYTSDPPKLPIKALTDPAFFLVPKLAGASPLVETIKKAITNNLSYQAFFQECG